MFRAFGVAMAVVGMTISAGAESLRFELRDWLGQEWRREVVEYPVAFAEGACAVGSLVLTGPDGRVPVQLMKLELWPDGSAKSGQLVWVTDLSAQEKREYMLAYGKKDAPPLTEAGDLQVRREAGMVELATSTIGVRLIEGEQRYETGMAASAVSGPVAGLWLSDGRWFGGSRLTGPGKVVGYTARVTAEGPAVAAWECRYDYEDGRQLSLEVRLGAGDSRLEWGMLVTPYDAAAAARLVDYAGFNEGERIAANRPVEDGWQLLLTPGREALRMHTKAEFYNERNPWGKQVYEGGKWVFEEMEVMLADEPAGRRAALVPWEDWWDGTTRTKWDFNTAEAGSLFRLMQRDPGVWVEPAAPGTWASWGNPRQRQKWVYLVKTEEGDFAADFNLASGHRKWFVDALLEAVPKQSRALNELKDWQLSWERAPEAAHPHVYMTAAEVAQAQASRPVTAEEKQRLASRWKGMQAGPHGSDADALGLWLRDGTAAFAADALLVERLRNHLGLLGDFDRMRHVGILVGLYDALIDSGLVPAEEVPKLQGQMAYLGYLMADPSTWSMERGYCSGNQNMSVSYTLNLGMIAALLFDHPKAREWAHPAMAMMEKWLAESVGPKGEWPESVCNYAHVSASALLPFVIAAHNAGFHEKSDFADYLDDPRLKLLFTWLAKYYTPLDPRSGGQRKAGLAGTAPLGRAGAGGQFGLAGIMARAQRDLDPVYSRHQQWSWLQTGKSLQIANTQMGGWEYVYADETLPAEVPEWGFDFFPETGTLMRHGIGTEDEWYIAFMIEYSFGYPSESGNFPCIWAKGVPISSRFAGGYAEREEILLSRVLPARGSGTIEERQARFFHRGQRRVTESSALPHQDYVSAKLTIESAQTINHFGGHNHLNEVPAWPPVEREATGPVDWTRQVLFVRDYLPGGTNYLVLRDTVTGDQPTMWQFWTITDKIGTPDEVRDREAFLADKPGKQILPPRALEGDRFTALGQFGVDVEYYVASPRETPRHTLRWGRDYKYTPIHLYEEYMDLFHLQMGGDGAYFVAIFPRRADEPVPTFTTLADGHVIKVQGEFGTDYSFLSPTERAVEAEGLRFLGTAASVQDRSGGVVLSLGAAGSVQYGEIALACDQGVSLILGGEFPVIRPRNEHVGAQVRFRLPGEWTVDTGKGATIETDGEWLYVKLRADMPELLLYPQ